MNWISGILRISVSLAVVWVIFISALLWTAKETVDSLFFLQMALIPGCVIVLLGVLVSWVLKGFRQR